MKLKAAHKLLLRLLGIAMACFGSATSARPTVFAYPFPMGCTTCITPPIPVFDDGVFQFAKPTPDVSYGLNGSPRWIDPGDPGSLSDSNRRQRDLWVRQCEPKRRKGYAAFKRCYEQLRAAEIGLQQQAAETENVRATVRARVFETKLPFQP